MIRRIRGHSCWISRALAGDLLGEKVFRSDGLCAFWKMKQREKGGFEAAGKPLRRRLCKVMVQTFQVFLWVCGYALAGQKKLAMVYGIDV